MPSKRVLIFIDWFLPGYKAGGPISSIANLVDHLSGEIEFYIITRNTDYCETTPYPEVTSDAWNVLPSGANVYYVSSKQLSFKTLSAVSKSLDFDVVFINGIYSLYFSLFPLIWFKYFRQKKVVVSARGMLSEQTFSSKKVKKKLFYFIARITRLYKGITIHATNQNEADQIRKNVSFKGDIKVAPNLPPKANNQKPALKNKTRGELRLVSIARISPEKNIFFALEILEKLIISLNHPSPASYHIIFDLFGIIYDKPYWKQCEAIIARLPSNVQVNFCGPLEKTKIQEALAKYHFLFMPSQGENYGHSIIESFLAGCPVIISDRTPWKGLVRVTGGRWQSARSEEDRLNGPAFSPEQTIHSQLRTAAGIGWDLPLEQPEKFVEVIECCIAMDQETYNAMSLNTWEYALKITNDPQVLEANRRLFEA